MKLPLTTRSTTLVSQVLFSGSIRDSLTGGAPNVLIRVRLIDRDTSKEYPIIGRVRSDGTFAFYGKPETAFPRLAEKTYHLQIEASAKSDDQSHTFYQSGAFNLEDLGPVSAQPALVKRSVPIDSIPDMEVRLFTGGGLPRTGITITLDRNPVRLRGQVRVSDAPTIGVGNAQLTIIGGPTIAADAEGRFEFRNPLPVAQSIELRVRKPGSETTTTLTYEPDYTQPINYLLIGLKGS